MSTNQSLPNFMGSLTLCILVIYVTVLATGGRPLSFRAGDVELLPSDINPSVVTRTYIIKYISVNRTQISANNFVFRFSLSLSLMIMNISNHLHVYVCLRSLISKDRL